MSPRYPAPADLVEWIDGLIRAGSVAPFYNSPAWDAMRKEVLHDQHHECQICKAKGKAEPASTVHHVRPVRERPDLALTKDNLIAVCESCHYEIHHPSRSQRWPDERW